MAIASSATADAMNLMPHCYAIRVRFVTPVLPGLNHEESKGKLRLPGHEGSFMYFRLKAEATRTAGCGSGGRERYRRAVGTAPRGSELAIVGPDPQMPVASTEHGETPVGPIRLVVGVARQPLQRLEPEASAGHRWNGVYLELAQQRRQPLALAVMRQMETCFGQHRLAGGQLHARERLQLLDGEPVF